MNISEAKGIMGIDGSIPSEEKLKSLYRNLMFKWHPDTFQCENDIRRATDIAQKINIAYELLGEFRDDYKSSPGNNWENASTGGRRNTREGRVISIAGKNSRQASRMIQYLSIL